MPEFGLGRRLVGGSFATCVETEKPVASSARSINLNGGFLESEDIRAREQPWSTCLRVLSYERVAKYSQSLFGRSDVHTAFVFVQRIISIRRESAARRVKRCFRLQFCS